MTMNITPFSPVAVWPGAKTKVRFAGEKSDYDAFKALAEKENAGLKAQEDARNAAEQAREDAARVKKENKMARLTQKILQKRVFTHENKTYTGKDILFMLDHAANQTDSMDIGRRTFLDGFPKKYRKAVGKALQKLEDADLIRKVSVDKGKTFQNGVVTHTKDHNSSYRLSAKGKAIKEALEREPEPEPTPNVFQRVRNFIIRR